MRVDDDGGTAGASSGADAHAGASGGSLFNTTGSAARVFWTRTLIRPAFPRQTSWYFETRSAANVAGLLKKPCRFKISATSSWLDSCAC